MFEPNPTVKLCIFKGIYCTILTVIYVFSGKLQPNMWLQFSIVMYGIL